MVKMAAQRVAISDPYVPVWEAAHSADIGPTAMLVLLVLARQQLSIEDDAWLTKREVADRSRLHPNTVMNHLQTLGDAGLIIRQMRTDPVTGAPQPSLYQIALKVRIR